MPPASASQAESEVRTFRLPLPPTGTNHAYRVAVRFGQATVYKAEELKAWEAEVRLRVLHGWQAPHGVPLGIVLVFSLPRRLLRKLDLDGPVKSCVDVLIGTRWDQWVDMLDVRKVPTDGEGEVLVTVRQMQALGPAEQGG